MNLKFKMQNVKSGLLLLTFLIFNFTSYIPALPVFAVEQPTTPTEIKVGPFCFRKEECKTYKATESTYPDPVCQQTSTQHNEAAKAAGYIYNCWASPPTTKLQVSIGGYEVKGIEDYIRRLYIFFVGISGITAGVMIVWAGVKWLTSAGNPERISDAKHKISNALIGLVLVLNSYVILNTVNPDLVKLKLPPIKIPRTVLTETQAWCVNRSDFPCGGDTAHPTGKWSCSDQELVKAGNPPCEGGPAGGECDGQWCAEGTGGCQKVIKGRIASEYFNGYLSGSNDGALFAKTDKAALQKKLASTVCVDPTQCNACNINLYESEQKLNIDNVAKCLSTCCQCILINTQNLLSVTGVQCSKQKEGGQTCNANEECLSRRCSLAPAPDKCAPLQDGTKCDIDEDCQSESYCVPMRDSGIAGIGGGGAHSSIKFCSSGETGRPCCDGLQCDSSNCVGWDFSTGILGTGIGASLCSKMGTCK